MTRCRRDVGSPDPAGEFLRYRTLVETAGDSMFVLRGSSAVRSSRSRPPTV
jgi:hypothetical protein